jgi:hypothetical protein
MVRFLGSAGVRGPVRIIGRAAPGRTARGTQRPGVLVTAIGNPTARLTGHVKSDQSLVDFARWAAAQLGFTVSAEGGALRIHLPEDARDQFGGEEMVSLVEPAAAPSGPAGGDWSDATVPSPVLDWLCDELRRDGPAVHARPADQPEAVSALAPRLFVAYQIDGGRIHLAGCRLEDRPFLRFTFAVASDAPFKAVRHVWVAEDLSRVPDDQVAALQLDTLQPLGDPPRRLDEARLAAMLSAARRLAAHQQRSGDPPANVEPPLAAVVVWVKYAAGRLQFTVGERAVVLPFEGWARTLSPPPYVCPLSEVATFHLAATDDGRIAAAEAVATCARSGRRVLADELLKCHVTGQAVLPEFVRTCPVAGQPALADQFVECPTCRERVSRAVLTGRGCRGCDHLQPAPTDDPRLVSILGAHPGLGRWKRWRLGETRTAYILRADGLLHETLVVVDRATLEVRHVARRGRLTRRWAPLAPRAFQPDVRKA